MLFSDETAWGFLYNNLILTIVYDIQYTVTERWCRMSEEKELMTNLILELRRGTLILSVLSQMSQPRYGYSLVQNLENRSVSIDPNTLYPLLRRLEKQGILSSEWETGGSKPRKYYRRTRLGDAIYRELAEQWRLMAAGMEELLKEEQEDDDV